MHVPPNVLAEIAVQSCRTTVSRSWPKAKLIRRILRSPVAYRHDAARYEPNLVTDDDYKEALRVTGTLKRNANGEYDPPKDDQLPTAICKEYKFNFNYVDRYECLHFALG